MAPNKFETAARAPSILVHVTGDRIGDALIKWPVIAALKKALPQHRLVWLAGRRRSVFAGPLAKLVAGVIDEVHDFAAIGNAWSELCRPPWPGAYSIVIASEAKLRTAMLIRRIEHGVFISPALNFRFSDRRPREQYPSSVFEQMRCLATLAAGCELKIDTAIDTGAQNDALARQLLPAGGQFIGLAPGSAGARKRWPLEKYIELANLQIAAGRTPVFFLGPEEASEKEAINQAVPTALFPEQHDDAGEMSGPLLSIALAKRLVAGIANDAGGGHLLAAGGRPLITLFGHTSETKFKPPYGSRVAITAREYGGTEIDLIPVERVAQELERLLVNGHG